MMHFGDALNARNTVAFKQKSEHQLGLFETEIHAVQRLFLRLQERLRALATLIPLITLAVASMAFAFGSAIVAGHCGSPVESTADLPDNGVAGPSRTDLAHYPAAGTVTSCVERFLQPDRPAVVSIFAEALAAAMNPSCPGGNHAAVYMSSAR